MASNENPLGPSPKAVEAMINALGKVNYYPGIAELDLRSKLGPRINPAFDERNVLIGNGVTDILRMLCMAYLYGGGESVCSFVAFPMYFIFTRMFGGKAARVPARPDFAHDLPAMAKAINENTRLVFLASPNNPTGQVLSRAELEAFMAQVPDHVVVVMDEAYWDFAHASGHPDTTQYILDGRNVIVLRSFSKSMGLAGMRVGALFARPDIVEYLSHAVLPFHTGNLALAAANASLDDHDFLKRSVSLVETEREYFYREFDRLDLPYLRSYANFVLITKLQADPNWVCEQLIQRGIILRPMGLFGLPEAIRVTICKHEDNQRFIATLEEVLAMAPQAVHA
jgi:histidinol-phosphate aminotransferase